MTNWPRCGTARCATPAGSRSRGSLDAAARRTSNRAAADRPPSVSGSGSTDPTCWHTLGPWRRTPTLHRQLVRPPQGLRPPLGAEAAGRLPRRRNRHRRDGADQGCVRRARLLRGVPRGRESRLADGERIHEVEASGDNPRGKEDDPESGGPTPVRTPPSVRVAEQLPAVNKAHRVGQGGTCLDPQRARRAQCASRFSGRRAREPAGR